VKKNRPARIVAASLMALTLLTGCGGGDGGGRPTVEELSGAMQKEGNVLNAGLTADQSDCFAQALIDSDVSDATLQAVVDNDKDYKGDADDEKAMQSMSTEGLAECMAG
jgi:hypothetical protein